MIATKNPHALERTDNFKDILLFPNRFEIGIGCFIKAASAVFCRFNEDLPDLDYGCFLRMWESLRCIKIPEAVVCDSEKDRSDPLSPPASVSAQSPFCNAVKAYKDFNVDQMYLRREPFKKYMDLVVYGMMRSGTTLISDMLTTQKKSILLHEPDLLYTQYADEFPQNNEYRKTMQEITQFGIDVAALPPWDKGYSTFASYFDAVVYPYLKDCSLWGAKLIDFQDWEGFLTAYKPEKILLSVRDIRDVLLSACDLALTLNNLVVDECWIENRLLESCRELIRMSQLPHLAIRYEDLCLYPEIPEQILAYAGLKEAGSERTSIDKILSFRKYEIEKHGRGISNKSVYRYQKEPPGFIRALADSIWRKCAGYSKAFGYEVPASPYSGNFNLGRCRRDARRAALNLINAGDIVIDLSCGTMSLEPMLPKGCDYIPCDTAKRGNRQDIQLCDPNQKIYPDLSTATRIVALNILEYLNDPKQFFRTVADTRRPVIISYHPVDFIPLKERKDIGWINHFRFEELESLLKSCGLSLADTTQIDGQLIMNIKPE